MTSAAGSARIPYKHSSSTTTTPHRGPRYATSPLRARVPDVITRGQDPHTSGQEPLHLPAATESAAAKVDSRPKTAATTVKSRAHTRLPSFGRIALRGSAQQKLQQQPVSQGEAASAEVPVSPSDAGSHKRSDTSTLSNSSSETTLSDDAKSDVKSIEERSSRPSFWLASNNVPGEFGAAHRQSTGHYGRLAPHRPRMMHQTSSKLLRMTEDERPFTRVSVKSFLLRIEPSIAVYDLAINYFCAPLLRS